MMNWTRWLGKTTENQAAKYLKKCGFRIQHRNYQTPLGEIDIIAKQNEMLVFIEVKSLAFHEQFHPMDHFNYWKKKKQVKLAQLYLSRVRKEVHARFDLITVIKKDGDFFIEHYENVIDEASL